VQTSIIGTNGNVYPGLKAAIEHQLQLPKMKVDIFQLQL